MLGVSYFTDGAISLVRAAFVLLFNFLSAGEEYVE